jgi:hypothetical protein
MSGLFPVLTLLLAFLVLRERLYKVQIAGMLLAICRDPHLNANPVGHDVLKSKGLQWRQKPWSLPQSSRGGSPLDCPIPALGPPDLSLR